ncbi:MAG: hypothetical protein A4E52_01821 [Pelotomaculum sp. PtaB.Bin013]|nr:MAG: hypothetical protein A4E52_01821 [Pelotomaculum sp. PtaB.Bin013]
MAYSDYGSFVYMNGERRTDKEDVGVFDTDESNIPSEVRIFVNILKNRERNNNDWWNHSQHGVMGDGNIRVACYKQGFPTIYHWKEGEEKPTEIDSDFIIRALGLFGRDYVNCYTNKDTGKDEYYFDYEYPLIEFEYEGYKFKFISSDCSGSGHYEAEMIETNGTRWKCVYDYGYGAGF